jgi:hypothetical protein
VEVPVHPQELVRFGEEEVFRTLNSFLNDRFCCEKEGGNAVFLGELLSPVDDLLDN